ncbi:hypothetical protein C5Y96_12295 [Blastopirellula marina]|uniref:Uncharacterized protein n=1 Tax=Blastopirellula marina TaxID=124 RepID=A0A2S8FG26_9BACT|nr:MULTISPECIES: hypothetical protein [Pirellulaceae]PQO31128.1 hypothetical protein C5Y96_12295 [Blastopirellula marina]RCS51522.1 hypothetical protein DTL36_12305 [Bremerella cremea]
MPDTYAILREADCRLDLDKASEIMGPYLGLAKAEMLQALHNSPGILANHVEYDAARDISKALILAGMPCRVVHDDHLILVPAIPRVTIRGMAFTEEHLVFRSVDWEGHIPWQHIRLLDIVQEVEEKVEIVSVIEGNREGHSKKPERKAHFEVSVFLEIVCSDPVLRMRIDRSLFRYTSTGLKMHTNREMNFRALCIALHMRSPEALIGPGFSWLSKGNNTHHQNGNTLKKFENFATWLLTVEA